MDTDEFFCRTGLTRIAPMDANGIESGQVDLCGLDCVLREACCERMRRDALTGPGASPGFETGMLQSRDAGELDAS